MELLIKVAGNLERHAQVMERLADQLEEAAPKAKTSARRLWDEERIDDRIAALRRQSKLARRAIGRIEATLATRGTSGSEREAA